MGAQTDQAPTAVSPWELNSGSLVALPTRFPYLAHSDPASAHRPPQQPLQSFLIDPPPALPPFSAHPSVEEWERAQISLCLHRLFIDLIGHLHLPRTPLSAVSAPLLAFRQSFLDLCSQHSECLLSGWEELQVRMEDSVRALLLQASTAGQGPLTAVTSAIDCTARRLMRRVRKEAEAEDETQDEQLSFDSLQHLRRCWMEAGGRPATST